ncbi:MAG: M48 family metalloprotease [Elusimicrobia bacterium]|nr:M48 family metalloprotease [Elusimicrobiota bacterium]
MPRWTLDETWLKSLRTVPGIASMDYEYSGDRTTLAALKALPAAGWIFKKWLEFWLEFDRIRYLGSAVRVSERQFPEVHALQTRAAELLAMTAPPLFVIEAPYVNAFTLGTDDGKSFLLVTRALLDVATDRELMFILGHELGHVKSQHVLYGTMAIYLANAGLFAGARLPGFNLLALPVQMALNAWFRRSEVTCDRAGLIACQHLQSARKALLLTGCGSRELADRIDLTEFAKQGLEASSSYGKWGEMFNRHPYMPKRLRALELFAESHFYLRQVLRDKESRFLDSDDMDRAVGEVLGDDQPDVERVSESADDGRLRVALALAGAWADGEMTGPRRRALERLLEDAGGGEEGAKALAPYLSKRLPKARVLRELRHFTGERLRALPYAFSLFLIDPRRVSFLEARWLIELGEASGLSRGEAESLVYDASSRKALFKQRCGSDICVRCGQLFEARAAACPACAAPASALDEPEARRFRSVAEKLDGLRDAATKGVAAAGNALLGFAKSTAAAYAAKDESAAPPPKPKTRRRKHEKS